MSTFSSSSADAVGNHRVHSMACSGSICLLMHFRSRITALKSLAFNRSTASGAGSGAVMLCVTNLDMVTTKVSLPQPLAQCSVPHQPHPSKTLPTSSTPARASPPPALQCIQQHLGCPPQHTAPPAATSTNSCCLPASPPCRTTSHAKTQLLVVMLPQLPVPPCRCLARSSCCCHTLNAAAAPAAALLGPCGRLQSSCKPPTEFLQAAYRVPAKEQSGNCARASSIDFFASGAPSGPASPIQKLITSVSLFSRRTCSSTARSIHHVKARVTNQAVANDSSTYRSR